jgi:hypothetical protein
VAVWFPRAVAKLPVCVHVRDAGSYSSADAVTSPPDSLSSKLPIENKKPPATSTWPDGRRVAVCCQRGEFIEPVADQVPVIGS